MEKAMKTVKVRNLVIGEGKPKICVPLIGDAVSVLQTAEGVKKCRADLAEWRIDTDTDPDNEKQILQTAEKLRSILGDMPLLFTFRTKEEGGSAAISEERYRELNKEMICSGLIDLVDVEFFKMRATVESLVREAEAHRVRTVLSNHDFAKTPPRDEIIRRLCAMQEAGADLAKIAVMPQADQDVIELLNATWTMKRLYPTTPVITMSMGVKGAISRICGELYGSAVTFASYEKASAPGQMHVEEVYEILEKLHV